MRSIAKFLMFIGLCVGLVAPVWANATVAPDELVRESTESLLLALGAGRIGTAEAIGLVEKIVLPHIDFTKISAYVLGRAWATATPQQRLAFSREFQALIVRTYTAAITGASGLRAQYAPVRYTNPDDASMRVDILQTQVVPLQIQYRLYRGDKGWKVYDMAVDGVSLVSNYRTAFADEVKQKGLDALIQRLTSVNQQAAKG